MEHWVATAMLGHKGSERGLISDGGTRFAVPGPAVLRAATWPSTGSAANTRCSQQSIFQKVQ